VEVFLEASHVIWRWFFFAVTTHKQSANQHPFMLPLEMMGPGGSLSMVLLPCPMARCQSENVLAGGIGDSGIQLRPDVCSALPSAGERLAVATVERLQFLMAIDSKLWDSHIVFTSIQPFFISESC
jgi:hypothetical protein